MKLAKAVQHIERDGILLVYPITNKKEPPSLWTRFFPRKTMRWEWDNDGDNQVAGLWYLRMELSESRKVVYAKWYQGRATCFSFAVFEALLVLARESEKLAPLSRQAHEILQLLIEDSPLSTKEIKLATDLRGRSLESTYARAMKELWNHLLIVGFGEKDDGAFPSLAIGATSAIFEELVNASEKLSLKAAKERIEAQVSSEKFKKHIAKLY